MDDLQQWLRQYNIDLVPVLNGKVHRFGDGDSHGEKPLWYVGSVVIQGTRRVTTFSFGDWRVDGSKPIATFRSGGEDFKNGEAEKYYAQIEERKKEAEKERLKEQEEAAKEAESVWTEAHPATADHQYLVKKQAGGAANFIRQEEDVLLIPMRDIHGKLWGVQRIFPDGQKRFLAGQRKHGCFFKIEGENSSHNTLYVAEGLATGLSVFQATGGPVFVSFDAGNLPVVAKILRDSGIYRERNIIICGDDDKWGEKNIGKEKATQAAESVGGIAVFPEFTPVSYDEKIAKPTDFNDLHCLEGLDEVRRQIESAIQYQPNSGEKAGEGEDSDTRDDYSKDNDKRKQGAAKETEMANDDGDGNTKKEETPEEKAEKEAKRQKRIESLGKKILDCRFKIFADNEATILYNITNINKKEVVVCTNEEILLRRLKANIEEKTGRCPREKYVKEVYNYWRLSTDLLPEPPRSFTWGNEDEWSFKRLDFIPMEGEYESWWEFLKRLSSADDFMAFIWSVFEPKNTSRQFLWLSDLHGEGGKSTVISVLAEIFGDSFEALNNTNTGQSSKWLMGQLYGKRLAAWPDCKNPQFCMSEIVRNITSGDWVTVEMKGQPLFSTKMYMKLIVGSNYEPAITGSGADTSRLIHLKLEEGEVKDDPTWKDRLKAELPYFLWACREVYKAKCPHHGKIALHESTKEHVENASGVTEEKFEEIAESRLIIGEGLTSTVKQFHDLCKEEGFRDNFEVGNFKVFLRRKGIVLKRPGGNKPRLYYGMNIVNRT